MPTRAYLTDLRYNYSGVLANDCMPLGVGYMKAVMDRDLPEVESRLFAYPDRLWDAIRTEPPDVLMLSNYCWNEALSFHFAKLAKRVRPDMLVVMGGPNITLDEDRRAEYFNRHPEIDLYVLGEGDFLATEVMRHFLDAGKSIRKMGERTIPSSLYRRDGETIHEKTWPRKPEIDEIPSPWLTGVLDEFFDGSLAPMMETNRGCPFTCTFCVQGVNWYTKVHNFGQERVKEELSYVARRVRDVCPTMGTLRIADSNYGMFERDIEISAHIGKLQQDFGWPFYIDATTGKNRADRIIKSVEKVGGALVVYQAVQSLDDTVLKNIKRSTIKLQAYEQLLMYIRGRGMRSNSDLILGLPGETLQTHVDSIHKLLDSGASQVTNFQLMLLKGSELETRESREQFHFQTKFRVLPKNFGVYGDEQVFDVEEIVVGTDTLSFDDYVQARKYALVSVAFWHDNLLEDALKFAESVGVRRSAWLDTVLELMEQDQGAVRRFIDNFVSETTNELFDTREECIAFYSRPEAFERLKRAEIGDNLMHKYHAIASFHIWPEICSIGMQALRRLLLEKGIESSIPNFKEFWEDFESYTLRAHAAGRVIEDVLTPDSALLHWDFSKWVAAGVPVDLGPFQLDEPAVFDFRLGEEGARELRKAFAVWTSDLKGLSKLVTRIQATWQVRAATARQEMQGRAAVA